MWKRLLLNSMRNCNIEEKGRYGISFLGQRLGKVQSRLNTNIRPDRTEHQGSHQKDFNCVCCIDVRVQMHATQDTFLSSQCPLISTSEVCIQEIHAFLPLALSFVSLTRISTFGIH